MVDNVTLQDDIKRILISLISRFIENKWKVYYCDFFLPVSERQSSADLVCSGGNWRVLRSHRDDRERAVCSAAVVER